MCVTPVSEPGRRFLRLPDIEPDIVAVYSAQIVATLWLIS
jgi:hypothetical protein